MDTLMHSEEAQKVRRRFVGCGAAFPLPEGGAEVVTFGEHCSFADVETLGDGVEVKEATGEL